MDPARNPAAARYYAERPHLDIWCYWPSCQRHIELNASEIADILGPPDQVDLRRLNRILKCSQCGARARDKRVHARWSSFDDALENHRKRLVAEIEKWGAVQTSPLHLPGIGRVYPADLGVDVNGGLTGL